MRSFKSILEEACTAALKLLGYDVATLSGSFPAAQLNKASSLGLRAGLSAVQGQGLTLEDAAVLFYNALTASTAENQTYAATLGFTVTDGRIDLSSVLLSSVEGPFVADGTTQLPFVPAAVYRNDTVGVSIAMKKLRENGYIAVDGEGNLTLLEPGLEIAQRIYRRHQLLTHFFVQLGVDEQTAAEDACKAEHILSEQTLEKIRESALRNDAAHPQAK